MARPPERVTCDGTRRRQHGNRPIPSFAEAQAILEDLASAFLLQSPEGPPVRRRSEGGEPFSDVQAIYRTLVEQIPAVVFLVYLDGGIGIGEAYVSPHIEATLGYTQAEWLEDPVRWYHQIHPKTIPGGVWKPQKCS